MMVNWYWLRNGFHRTSRYAHFYHNTAPSPKTRSYAQTYPSAALVRSSGPLLLCVRVNRPMMVDKRVGGRNENLLFPIWERVTASTVRFRLWRAMDVDKCTWRDDHRFRWLVEIPLTNWCLVPAIDLTITTINESHRRTIDVGDDDGLWRS